MDAGFWGAPSTFLLVMPSCLSMSGPEQAASLCVRDDHCRMQTGIANVDLDFFALADRVAKLPGIL